MKKISWHKVVTREYSFLWASYTASAYKIMKKLTGTELRYNLFYSRGRVLTIYREEKDVNRSYQLIDKLIQKNPEKVVAYMDTFEGLVKENYQLFTKIKKTKNKEDLKKQLVELDKLFLQTVVYYLYFVFLGYGANLPHIKKWLVKNRSRFEKIRSFTIDMDMHTEFPNLFFKLNSKLKEHTLFMTRQELVKSIKGHKVNWNKIKTRQKEALVIVKNNISGEYPFHRIKRVLDIELSHLIIDKDIKFLKGSIACKGQVSGLVVLVLKKEDYKKIKSDNIVVTSMTKPEIVPYIKNVKGIITNDGGALSHASIISRELKIPCIVGTTYATDILKNGERVLLDANSGIVTRNI